MQHKPLISILLALQLRGPQQIILPLLLFLAIQTTLVAAPQVGGKSNPSKSSSSQKSKDQKPKKERGEEALPILTPIEFVQQGYEVVKGHDLLIQKDFRIKGIPAETQPEYFKKVNPLIVEALNEAGFKAISWYAATSSKNTSKDINLINSKTAKSLNDSFSPDIMIFACNSQEALNSSKSLIKFSGNRDIGPLKGELSQIVIYFRAGGGSFENGYWEERYSFEIEVRSESLDKAYMSQHSGKLDINYFAALGLCNHFMTRIIDKISDSVPTVSGELWSGLSMKPRQVFSRRSDQSKTVSNNLDSKFKLNLESLTNSGYSILAPAPFSFKYSYGTTFDTATYDSINPNFKTDNISVTRWISNNKKPIQWHPEIVFPGTIKSMKLQNIKNETETINELKLDTMQGTFENENGTQNYKMIVFRPTNGLDLMMIQIIFNSSRNTSLSEISQITQSIQKTK